MNNPVTLFHSTKIRLFGKTHLNRFGSHPNHENHSLYKRYPPHASPGPGKKRIFLNFNYRSAVGYSVSVAVIIETEEHMFVGFFKFLIKIQKYLEFYDKK
jgi:hypothetical protein